MEQKEHEFWWNPTRIHDRSHMYPQYPRIDINGLSDQLNNIHVNTGSTTGVTELSAVTYTLQELINQLSATTIYEDYQISQLSSTTIYVQNDIDDLYNFTIYLQTLIDDLGAFLPVTTIYSGDTLKTMIYLVPSDMSMYVDITHQGLPLSNDSFIRCTKMVDSIQLEAYLYFNGVFYSNLNAGRPYDDLVLNIQLEEALPNNYLVENQYILALFSDSEIITRVQKAPPGQQDPVKASQTSFGITAGHPSLSTDYRRIKFADDSLVWTAPIANDGWPEAFNKYNNIKVTFNTKLEIY